MDFLRVSERDDAWQKLQLADKALIFLFPPVL